MSVRLNFIVLLSLLCASGCSFMQPDFFETRKYSFAEVYYQDDLKMVSSDSKENWGRAEPSLRVKHNKDKTTDFVFRSSDLYHFSHRGCNEGYSITRTHLEVVVTLPLPDLSVEQCLDMLQDKYLRFTHNTIEEDGLVISADPYRFYLSTFKRSEGWLYILPENKGDKYREFKFEYKNVYKDHTDSFMRGRAKIKL